MKKILLALLLTSSSAYSAVPYILGPMSPPIPLSYIDADFASILNGTAGSVPLAQGLTGSPNISVGTITTGLISGTLTSGKMIDFASATTGNTYGRFSNTSGNFFYGVEGSVGGSLITGSSAYDGVISAANPISFSANNGANLHMRLSSTGLAVGGLISGTLTSGKMIDFASATTGNTYGRFSNTSGNFFYGVEGSVGGSLITDSSAYDGIISTANPISFSTNDGANLHMRLSSTGLAVGGTVSATNTITFAATGGLDTTAFSSSSTTTGSNSIQFNNTGGQAVFGLDNSTGVYLASGIAYATTIYSSATPIVLSTNGKTTIFDTSGNLSVSGSITAGSSFSGAGTGLTGTAASLSIGGNAATATAFASTPTACSSGKFATTIAANGNLGCATPAGSSVFSSVNNVTTSRSLGAGPYTPSATSPTFATISIGNSSGASVLITGTVNGSGVYYETLATATTITVNLMIPAGQTYQVSYSGSGVPNLLFWFETY